MARIIGCSSFFAWINIHVFYISNNPQLQNYEYFSVWKYATLSFIFGLGLTFGIKIWPLKNLGLWIAIGLSASILIYLVKFFATNYLASYLPIPDYLMLFKGSKPFYVPKISYVFFLMPVLIYYLVLASLSVERMFERKTPVKNYLLFFEVMGVMSIFIIFILENIKNGIAYSFLLVFLYVTAYLISHKTFTFKFIKIPLFILLLASFSLFINVKQNQSWQNFVADVKVAVDVDKSLAWLDGDVPLPLNEYGVSVSGTNYDRVSWVIIGLRLLKDYPLGYGVLQSSFGHLAKKEWPNSGLAQSHSGWLDLALGFGIPGVVLLIGSFILGLRHCLESSCVLKRILLWSGFGIILIYFTTELAQKIYIEALFLILGSIFGPGLVKSKSSC